MGAGTRTLAGCGCLALVAATALVAGAGLGLLWLRDEVERLAGGLETVSAVTDEIDAWEARANAHPWNPRPDGVIPEERLISFLEVRRRVHSVYETHKADLEALGRGPDAAVDDPKRLLALGGGTARMFVELRLAHVRALAEVGMSEPEYRSIQLAVYKAVAAERSEAGIGRRPAEAVADTTRGVQEVVRRGIDRAREAGLPGADRVGEDRVEEIETRVGRIGTSGAEALSVPPENVVLFRKHEAEIERYAMHGLAFLGL